MVQLISWRTLIVVSLVIQMVIQKSLSVSQFYHCTITFFKFFFSRLFYFSAQISFPLRHPLFYFLFHTYQLNFSVITTLPIKIFKFYHVHSRSIRDCKDTPKVYIHLWGTKCGYQRRLERGRISVEVKTRQHGAILKVETVCL